MKLKNIKISNYRCFKEAEIGFDNHITLVVGKNGPARLHTGCSSCLSQYLSIGDRWWRQ